MDGGRDDLSFVVLLIYAVTLTLQHVLSPISEFYCHKVSPKSVTYAKSHRIRLKKKRVFISRHFSLLQLADGAKLGRDVTTRRTCELVLLLRDVRNDAAD